MDTGVQQLLRLLGRRWVLAVMEALRARPRRFNDLHRAIGPPVSDRALVDTLRDLQDLGLVDRVLIDGTEPAAGYVLTPLAGSLLDALAGIRSWNAQHWREMGTHAVSPQEAGGERPDQEERTEWDPIAGGGASGEE